MPAPRRGYSVFFPVIVLAFAPATATRGGPSSLLRRIAPLTVEQHPATTTFDSAATGVPQSSIRTRRAAKKTDTPTPAPSTVTTTTITTAEPTTTPPPPPLTLTTSSFGIIPSDTDVPSPLPSSTPLATHSLDQAASSETVPAAGEFPSRRRKRRLVAILVPLLVTFSLAFLILFAVRRRRIASETYAELESDASSSSSSVTIVQGSGDGDEPAIIPVRNEAQFTLPSFKLPKLPSGRRLGKEASDSIVIQVERLEIADAGQVVQDGVLFLAGAAQLAAAHERATCSNPDPVRERATCSPDTTRERGTTTSSLEDSPPERTNDSLVTDHQVDSPGPSSDPPNNAPPRDHVTALSGEMIVISESKTSWSDPCPNASSSSASSLSGDEWLEWACRGDDQQQPSLKLSPTTETEGTSVSGSRLY